MQIMGKADMRLSLKKANPKLTASEQKMIANSMMAAKAFLSRKKRNLKTGQKTAPVFQKLLTALSGFSASSQPEEGKGRHHHCAACRGGGRKTH